MNVLFTILTAVLPVTASPIKSDEVVVLYPGYGQLEEEDGQWSFAVHGKIFEPETSSWRRGATVATLRRTLRVEKGTPQYERFQSRVRLFLVDNEGGKEISVRIGDHVYPAGTSAANGHFQTTVRLSPAEVNTLLAGQPAASRWIDLAAVVPEGDPRRFAGRVQLIGARGLSIVSDIDDTIKHTQVTDRKAMLANTFLHPFRPVPGMAALYRKAAAGGAVFHYVSGSPWQLFEPLEAFRRHERFPAGSFHLKQFRLKDSSATSVLSSQQDYKAGHIEPILAAFPGRRFLLVGDSGEQDPEIYGRLARQHPKQIVAVWIRNVTAEKPDSPRFQRAFQGVDDRKWRLFDRAEQLEPHLGKLLAE